MTWVRERHGHDIVQLMLDASVMSQASGDSYVLKFALESGGYIAGGFARLLYRHLQGLEDTVMRDALYKYLELQVPIEPTISSNAPRPKHRGDIDVWFPDEISAKDFWRKLNACAGQSGFGLKREKSIAGYATNIIANNRLMFQIVTHVFGPPEEIMSGFDISNCMIAITKEGYVYHELFPELESQRILDVAAWTSLHTIPRFIKYLNHRGLQSITDETSRGFVEYSVEALEDLKKNPDVDVTGLEVRPTTEKDILSVLKQMKPYITNDSIMFLLALGFDNKLGYESLTKYLKRRAGIP